MEPPGTDGGGGENSDTHGHRLDGFDELLALQVLQDLVDLRQREVALKTNVSAPDPCRMTATQQHDPGESLQARSSRKPSGFKSWSLTAEVLMTQEVVHIRRDTERVPLSTHLRHVKKLVS